jgi:hypothetical protein
MSIFIASKGQDSKKKPYRAVYAAPFSTCKITFDILGKESRQCTVSHSKDRAVNLAVKIPNHFILGTKSRSIILFSGHGVSIRP